MGKGGKLVASDAGIAQLVEQLIRNQQVVGSSPIPGSSFPLIKHRVMAEH